MDQPTSKLVFKMVQSTFNHLGLPAQKNLADLIMAFFYNRSFTLWEIASCLSGETTTKHKHKRLLYFLDQFSLDSAFWKSFIIVVFSLPGFRFKSRKYITLALDATTLKDDFWMLAVSISYQGRSIPIYLKSWAGVNESYDYWKRVRDVLGELKELLPEGYRYELVADRGFQGEQMLRILHQVEWDYVVRVNGCWRMKQSDGSEFVQLNLFADGWYEQVTLGKQAQLSPVNVAVSSSENEEGGCSRWYVMTNVGDRDHVISSYCRRFWIEESFKDLKSKLKWESYTKKVPAKDRLTKCITVSCLSYAIQTSLGSQLSLSPSERKKTSVFNSFRQAYRRSSQKLEKIITKFIAMISTYIRRTKVAFS
jgi:hypothetical protein